MQAHLSTFGNVVGLALGWFGEINRGFDSLLCTAADIGAERLWSDLNCTTVAHAKGVLVWPLRRKMAAAISRANVNHLFSRIALLTGDPAAAASRRAASSARFFASQDPAFSTAAYNQSNWRGASGAE